MTRRPPPALPARRGCGIGTFFTVCAGLTLFWVGFGWLTTVVTQ